MSETDFEKRITFHDDFQIMEVDFSHLRFASSAQVNAFYDEIDRRIEATGRKWYFLVNYDHCEIEQAAWFAFGYRGKKVNLAHSLGTVRFNARPETEGTIKEKAEAEAFDPNLFRSRKAALARLMGMQRDDEAAGTA